MKIIEIELKFNESIPADVQIWRKPVPHGCEILSATAEEGIAKLWCLVDGQDAIEEEGIWVIAIPADTEIPEVPGTLAGVFFHLGRTWHVFGMKIRHFKPSYFREGLKIV